MNSKTADVMLIWTLKEYGKAIQTNDADTLIKFMEHCDQMVVQFPEGTPVWGMIRQAASFLLTKDHVNAVKYAMAIQELSQDIRKQLGQA
jgi:hypothetical protein